MQQNSEFCQKFNEDRKMILVRCNVCEIWCDTLDQFFIHKKSTKHIKKFEIYQMSNSKQLTSVSTTSELVNSDGDILNQTLYDTEYVQEYHSERQMNLVRCKVCNIWCDTLDQFLLHQKSVKHEKKAERFSRTFCHNQGSLIRDSSQSSTSDSTTSAFYCQICELNCNTPEQLSAHFSGQSHKKRSLKHEYKDWKSADIPQPNYINNTNQSKVPEFRSLPIHNTPKAEMTSITTVKENPDRLSSDQIKKLLTPERAPNSIRCVLCNKVTNTEEQYKMHCGGSQHMRKVGILNLPENSMVQELSDIHITESDMKVCQVCNILINVNNMESHEKGKMHKEKLVKQTHEPDVFDNLPRKRDISPSCEHIKSLKLVPRQYQTEVYEKSLKSDCVIFLPTGTGKTFVASMIILRMLEANTHHRVAFLVDKVLLVMQQHEFLRTQFEDISLKRFDKDGEKNRKLRLIGLANSFVSTKNALSVRDHDVVVATAELFRGLLSKKSLFWEEFGLVILDEAHHCVKDHPYNKLLREYQLFPENVLVDKTDVHTQLQSGMPKVSDEKVREWKERRCKLIGLTASPAGELDKEVTHTLLLELLKSLGGVDIVNVTENKAELDEYTSNSNIETRLVGYNEQETHLRDVLSTAFFFMISKFERLVSLNKSLLAVKDYRTLSVEDVSEFKSQLKMCLQEKESIEKSTINHIMSVLDIIDDVDTFGYSIGWKRLKELMDNDNEKVWFQDNTIMFLPQTEEIVKKPCPEESSIIETILGEAKNLEGESRTILVLVRERETARKLEKILTKRCINQKLILLVGHGAGGGKSKPDSKGICAKKDNKGMSVTKQKKALNLIKGRSNQIIVATSVADEGIDLPDCDLVILINPPTSVQALVQMRGRARKKTSRLLMICRDQKSIDDLEMLKVREKNIIESIELILAKNKV